jgi:hypothetical protein
MFENTVRDADQGGCGWRQDRQRREGCVSATRVAARYAAFAGRGATNEHPGGSGCWTRTRGWAAPRTSPLALGGGFAQPANTSSRN